MFEGYESLDRFYRFLLSSEHKGSIAIAHNQKGGNSLIAALLPPILSVLESLFTK